jgi:hypothetical protein
MGKTEKVKPVKLIMGIIACSEELSEKAALSLQKLWGKIDLRSPIIKFNFTDYYREEMGKNLLRQWLSFEKLINPEEISAIKIKTNKIEQEISIGNKRKINLDPGYADGAKLVLASTKNYSHRIYLDGGIYAEVTLIYEKNAFRQLAWTYPDYKSETALKFLSEARIKYLEQVK